MMLARIREFFSPTPAYRRIDAPRPFTFLITEYCVQAVCNDIEPYRKKGHEGITYLYGRTDGTTTLAIGAISPEATTTPGSFFVTSVEMARLVTAIRGYGLQLICQIHSHPGAAYHSDGDVQGLKLIGNGYVSIVLPKYGANLPNFTDVASFYYKKGLGFMELGPQQLKVIPETLL